MCDSVWYQAEHKDPVSLEKGDHLPNEQQHLRGNEYFWVLCLSHIFLFESAFILYVHSYGRQRNHNYWMTRHCAEGSRQGKSPQA
jgi:hypothetical protein